ncbi:MAG: cyclase [SAR202 cluster bacterium]|nr:cyclase [SAR202 cluster bacterium]
MTYVLVKHTVEDYAKWKPVFDQHAATRKSAGSKNARVFRSTENPNDVTLLFEWDSADRARGFVESTDLREVMQQAGAQGMPQITFLELAGQQVN